MRWSVALLLSFVVVVSCAGPVASVRPTAAGTSGPIATASAPATATPTAAPAATASPIAGIGDAFVTTMPAVDGVPTGAVLVEAVAPDGARRPVTTLSGITAGLPVESAIVEGEPILVSSTGFLTVVIEGPFDGPASGDPVARRLVVDLRSPARAPLVVGAGPAAWGPDGRLAIIGTDGATVIDPVTGGSTAIVIPESVDAAAEWTADGSALVASRFDPATDASIAGALTLDGRFVAGARPSWSATGNDRQFGADGTFVVDSVSDGPTVSEQAIGEQRVGSDRLVPWLVVHQPGPDPMILDHGWDAAGAGQWVILRTDAAVELVHIGPPVGTKPAVPEKRATLPPSDTASIVGVAPDDSAVILEVGGGDGTGLGLFRVDTRTGGAVRIDRPGGLSNFAGWIGRQ